VSTPEECFTSSRRRSCLPPKRCKSSLARHSVSRIRREAGQDKFRWRVQELHTITLCYLFTCVYKETCAVFPPENGQIRWQNVRALCSVVIQCALDYERGKKRHKRHPSCERRNDIQMAHGFFSRIVHSTTETPRTG